MRLINRENYLLCFYIPVEPITASEKAGLRILGI